jgi:uncharacterized protein (UPF0333 family)
MKINIILSSGTMKFTNKITVVNRAGGIEHSYGFIVVVALLIVSILGVFLLVRSKNGINELWDPT